MGEEAEFLGMRALSGTHGTIKVLKLSMEAAQEVIPSLEADFISLQNLEQNIKRGAGGRVETSLMTNVHSSL